MAVATKTAKPSSSFVRKAKLELGKTTASRQKPAGESKKPAKITKEGIFAVIETGGKQYQVSVGDVVTIEKLTGKKTGDKVVFDSVLLVDDGSTTQIGTPYLEGAKVEGVLEEEGRHKKVIVIKYKAKSRYLKKNGHRQPFVKVRISSIK